MGLFRAALSLFLINHILQNKCCCYHKQVHLLDSETDDITNLSNFCFYFYLFVLHKLDTTSDNWKQSLT